MSNIIDKIQLSGVTYDIGGQGGSGVSVVEVTQAEYDALPSSAKTDTSKMYVITDAEAGDLTNYYTKTETNTLLGGKADTATTYTKTEVDTALGGKADTATTYTKTEVDNAITAATATKQDQLVSGENIKTINNQSLLGSGNIYIQGGGGGGKAVSAGTNISITTGETADTINCTLPISAGTNALGVVANAIKIGENTTATSVCSIAVGTSTLSDGYRSFAGGVGSKARAEGTFTFGDNTNSLNIYETSFGRHNASNKANSTWGDSGNTLFSVGNGAYNARHNAFEIRQNGDIYLTKDGQDVKLQDQLGGGGSITIDPTLDSGSTNPVANSAITTALDNKANSSDVVLYNYGNSSTYNTAFVSSKTAYRIVVDLDGNGNWYFRVFDGSDFANYGVNSSGNFVDGSGNQIDAPYFINTDLTNYSSGTFDICFNTDNVYADYFANTAGYTFTIYESVSIKPLKTQVIENTTALATKQTTLTAGTGISIIDNVISATGGGGGGGMTEDDELLLSTALTDLNDRKIDASEVKSNYQKKGDYVTTNALNTRLAEYETALDEQNVEEVTAYALNDLNERFGGLKIVKMTESEYAALAAKDENTLYIVVADPS